MWPSALNSARAVFVDVAFVNNSMVGIVGAGSRQSVSVVLGGGGLLVAGGGDDSVVTVQGCSFVGNDVSVTDLAGTAQPCGGGACVLLGLASTPFDNRTSSNGVSNAVVMFTWVDASKNTVSRSDGGEPCATCARMQRLSLTAGDIVARAQTDHR